MQMDNIDIYSFSSEANYGATKFIGTLKLPISHASEQTTKRIGCCSPELVIEDITTVRLFGRKFMVKKCEGDRYYVYIPYELSQYILTRPEEKLHRVVEWLEANQPDVFQRGLSKELEDGEDGHE